jgi:hypothetical protein
MRTTVSAMCRIAPDDELSLLYACKVRSANLVLLCFKKRKLFVEGRHARIERFDFDFSKFGIFCRAHVQTDTIRTPSLQRD